MEKLEEFFDDRDLNGGRCHKCDYCKEVRATGNWSFYGCYHTPYLGKWVAEIQNCPKKAMDIKSSSERK